MSKPNITGQVMLWDRGPKPFIDGRHAVQIFGVLAMDPKVIEKAALDSWIKYGVIGDWTTDLGLVLAGGLPGQTEPVPAEINRGSPVNHLLQMPIWRA